ncbi:MAG TPA: rod shape-determining protein RodA, partial [Cytophagales bacterium]|nr:rod shape-determining protein RodA [Cytophagales bacterium]
IGFVILLIDYKFYDAFAYIIYVAVIGLLILVLLFARDVKGAHSWFEIGAFRFQPSEFAKFATSLALAKFLSSTTNKLDNLKTLGLSGAIILFPAALILLQNDTGSTLVFSAFIIMLYREGLNPMIPLLGIVAIFLFIMTLLVDPLYLSLCLIVLAAILIFIGKKNAKRIIAISVTFALFIGFVLTVNFLINNVFQEHQRNRIKVLVDPDIDPLGTGWNVTQSKIAIGSGGLLGKGFLEGTQTKFDFVPEQSTDFIFCTIGEEHGFIGTFLLILLFLGLFARIVFLAERQKSRFARIYGYCVVSIMFFHFLINIGMTIGLFPVIGIPLPFFSYGGSSLWSFTILLFIFLKLDSHRKQVLFRD